MLSIYVCLLIGILLCYPTDEPVVKLYAQPTVILLSSKVEGTVDEHLNQGSRNGESINEDGQFSRTIFEMFTDNASDGRPI